MPDKKKNGAAGAPSFNPRSMERMMRDLSKLLEQQNFDSIEEANAFLSTLTGQKIPELPPDDDPLSQANELVYQAYDADTLEDAVRLAKKAIKTSLDCADAYVLLAEIEADTVEQAHRYYKKGVEAGRRALGEEVFVEGEGHFWGIHETRPFMRAMAGLAESTWIRGDTDRAIELYREMLRLNPGDNQGIRYQLADCLLAEERYEELMAFFQEYEDDYSANWLYNRALVLFCMEGQSEESNAALAEAVEYNPLVPDYLLGKKKFPDELPALVGLGDESEAIEYAVMGIANWRTAFGAIKWLRERTKESKSGPKHRRS